MRAKVYHLLTAMALLWPTFALAMGNGGRASPCVPTANPLKRLKTNLCEMEMNQARCAQFFNENQIPQDFQRNCSEGLIAEAEDRLTGVFKSCPVGLFQAAVHNVATYVDATAHLWDTIKHNAEETAQAESFYSACDADSTLECKRALATESGLSFDDGVLKSQSARAIFGLGLKHAQSEARNQAIQRSVDFNSLPVAEKQRQLAEATTRSKTSGSEKMKALLAVVEAKLKGVGVQFACYKHSKQRELLCYGVGLIVLDPLVLGTAGLSKLRLVAGLGREVAAVERVEQPLAAGGASMAPASLPPSSSMISEVAGRRVPLDQLKAEIQNRPNLSAVEKTKLIKDTEVAFKQVDEIRRGYSDLLVLKPESETVILDKIARLEKAKIPRKVIRAEIKRAQTQCSIP